MFKKFYFGYFIFLLLFPSLSVFSMGYVENELNGNKLYKEGNFEGALDEYSEGLTKKANYNLYYNRGVSYYKLGQFDKSFSDFEDAATYANSKADQIKAVYNAGNSNYMMAETIKTEESGQAVEFYGKAVNHFERVLELDNNNQDASYNLELSRLKLDELKQQNEDQQDGDQQSDNKSEDGQQDGESKDGNGQDSEQQEQNSQGEESESASSSEEISPKDILNEEARRQEARQIIISTGSGEPVDKDW